MTIKYTHDRVTHVQVLAWLVCFIYSRTGRARGDILAVVDLLSALWGRCGWLAGSHGGSRRRRLLGGGGEARVEEW